MEQIVLSKKDILNRKELKRELLPVPEWGGSVWISEMSAEKRGEFDAWISSDNSQRSQVRLRLAIAGITDENGKCIFSDLDIPDLAVKSGNAIKRISDAISRISGMDSESQEETVKNSETDLKEDSLSDSVES